MTSTRWKQWGTVIAVVMVLTACNGRESVTGGYGSGVVTGKVTMAAGLSSDSPAGVRLSVAGTGISTVLTADGTFALSGVPDKAELRFSREDGINTSVLVAANGAPVSIQLSPNGGGKSGRVRAVNPIQPPYSEFEGTIKTPGTTQIVVTDSHQKDVTIRLTDSTVIRHGDTTIAAADLKAGDRIHVKATLKDNVYTATLVLVQNQADDTNGGDDGEGQGGTTMTANGTVKSVGSSSLVVTTVPKGDVTVQVDSSTTIRKQGNLITLADIKAGDEVNTMGTRIDDHTEKARQIEVRGSSGHH